MICPKCGEQERIRVHCDYITRELDFYTCEVCGHDFNPEPASKQEDKLK